MRRATLAVVFIGVVGCGSDGVSYDQAGENFRDEYCKYLARCHLVTSESDCHTLNVGISFTVDANLQAAIDAGKVKYDGSKVESCYARIGDFTCDRTDENGRVLASADCYNAITGTVGAGGQCALDEECKSTMCNVPDCPDACCQGTCVGDTRPSYPAHEGDVCQTTSDCASHLYCANAVCAPLKPAAATCISNGECDYGLGCAGTPRVCKTLPALGDACPDGTCRDDGTYCEMTTMTCKKLGLPGDACMTARDCSSLYGCDATMHCAVGPHEGQACTTAMRCADVDNFCDTATMTCKGRQPDGATCSSDNQCQSDFCNDTGTTSTCAPQTVCF